MKIGIRTPSPKRSLTARTTGKLTRAAKSAVNPLYGKKGMGLVNDPYKAVYNKVYNKTTVGVGDIVEMPHNTPESATGSYDELPVGPTRDKTANIIGNVLLCVGVLGLLLLLSGNILLILLGGVVAMFGLMGGAVFKFLGK